MDYKIVKISEDPPKEWGEGTNKTYYYKVWVEGVEKAISVGKKKLDSLHLGDTLTGTITPTEYDTDKFKPSARGNSIDLSEVNTKLDEILSIVKKSGYEQAKATAEALKTEPAPEYEGEQIDLSDVPF